MSKTIHAPRTVADAIAVWRNTAAGLALCRPPADAGAGDAFIAACDLMMKEAERRERIDLRGYIMRFKEDVLRFYRDRLPIDPGLGFGEADDAVNQLAQSGAHHPTVSGQSSPGRNTHQEPRRLLTGWHAITEALGEKYSQRGSIKSLNERLKGPISRRGKGTQPMVYKDDLIDWWNKMATLQQELASRHEGARLSAESQHNYGRDGKAAPEIGGGVKKRRRNKET